MSTDGDNIVRGRIRRYAAVHGRVIKTESEGVTKPSELGDLHKSEKSIQSRSKRKTESFQVESSARDPWESPITIYHLPLD
ncbi:MAG: hypothetical protein CO159_01930 [Candidatus Portnoybacteria bacterium CG_4_9_14_3_um_filter_40_10]|uniref:Uncharacterized protein n=1 Tax=Candidatus Portnoybacteria bacterium CG_4_9_14_3_um_filter_40_10 TaxID=1974804 RepID=A0A2M7YNV5_9BACT|nr:MAG: hypothetical protein CO159_01930 [Candidatus Portnoybacteria bacterium CG_4_9_14_3_um_filter_40_10]